jgi:hypothetical protein
MKKILNVILNPLVLCFILVISIALIIHLAASQEPTYWIFLSLLGVPLGLLISYFIKILIKRNTK